MILYKAEDRGVPVHFVDPRNTSKTCARCGAIREHRSSVGATFVCPTCDWRLDRQLNAGLNVARNVLATTPGLGALRLAPDGLPRDAVNPLYPPTSLGGHGRSGGEEGTCFDPAFGRVRG